MAAVTGREIAHALLGLREQLEAIELEHPGSPMERWRRRRALRYVKHEIERGRIFIRQVPATWGQNQKTD